MKGAIIIAKGEVQRVGYRDAVEKIARKLKITGFVENIKPYDVRIVAEGEDANINLFIEKIKIKKFPIEVESQETSFEDFKGEFEYFEIKRGDWQEELGERFDTAGTLLYRSVELSERSVELGEKSVELGEISVELSEESVEIGKTMLGKQDTTIAIIKSGVDEMREFRTETQHNFAGLDTKYGKIAENMERILEELKEERKEYRESIEKLVNAIIESKKEG
jgi:acylphosphatase